MSADPVSSSQGDGRWPKPATIRSQLPPDLAAIFDREWELVLEDAKRTQDLHETHDLLLTWKHFAAAEAKEPGWYFRVLETAERILAAGSAEAAGIKTYDARSVIGARHSNSEPPTPGNVTYQVSISEDARAATDALPAEAVTALAEAMNLLATSPWSGRPFQRR